MDLVLFERFAQHLADAIALAQHRVWDKSQSRHQSQLQSASIRRGVKIPFERNRRGN